MAQANRCFFYRFSRVKWHFIKHFFVAESFCHQTHNVQSLSDAKHKGLTRGDSLYFWGKKIDGHLLSWARQHSIQVFFVEDGFIRSLGLGSALSRPLSVVMDSRGIYFDPTGPSDLEWILEHQNFSDTQLNQAHRLIGQIEALKLSKYNHQADPSDLQIYAEPNQSVILVPGQVDDDMSVKFGGFGLNNMELLAQVRGKQPDAYIIYKPHPDVLSKNRRGDVAEAIPLQWADQVIKDAGIDTVLAQVDQVHTITSQVGFDALIRGIEVHTYGLPFYAGWGLTIDQRQSERRTRALTLEALVAASLLIYPHYVHPETCEPCSAFEAVDWLAQQKNQLQSRFWKRHWLKIKGLVFPQIRNALKRLRQPLR